MLAEWIRGEISDSVAEREPGDPAAVLNLEWILAPRFGTDVPVTPALTDAAKACR